MLPKNSANQIRGDLFQLIQDTKKYLEQQTDSFIFSSGLLEKKVVHKKIVVPPLQVSPQKPPPKKAHLTPAAAAKKPIEKEEKVKISLDLPKIQTDHLEDVRAQLVKIAPNLRIYNDIPSDEEAIRIACSYEYKNQASAVTILSFSETKEKKKLLQEIALSIRNYYFPCHLVESAEIEKEKQWDALLSAPNLRLLIASDDTIFQQPMLMQKFRENPSKSENFLGNIPLFMLPDLSLYLKDPLLKRSLWKALIQKLQLI